MLSNGEKRVVRSVLNIKKPMMFGDYVWNEVGTPAGLTWVRIDLGHQTLSVFRAGHEIGTTVILYGTDGKPTPTGIFPVLFKTRTHRSTLYDAQMPFMLRLTEDGVAIHASNVREGSATHGCIGVPLAFAKLLYGQMRRGDQVVIV
ncbi:L,D-transpeptidase family protein [Sphingomonas sp. TWP1-3-1]|uniref:L,D-transpeptidase family protein n=1 Tax=Sphingomonas sp. TWP1-3-1 TaxID=2804612 RepID=UPI003CEAE005